MWRAQTAASHAAEHVHALLASLQVRHMGLKIAQVAADGAGGGRYDHMKGLNWEFAVIDSAMPNAFVVPGGKASGPEDTTRVQCSARTLLSLCRAG